MLQYIYQFVNFRYSRCCKYMLNAILKSNVANNLNKYENVDILNHVSQAFCNT